MSNIIFNIIDWNDLEVTDDNSDSANPEVDNEYIIEAFGRTQNDKSVYLRITDYTPYFFVEIPTSWKIGHVDKFIKYIKTKVYYKFKEGLIDYDIVKRKKLYGFRAGKRNKFVRLVFQNNTSMKKYQYVFYNKHKILGLDNKERKYELYESNIPPLLRFMHIQDISSCGWVELSKDKYTNLGNNLYNTDINIEAKWTDVNSPKDEEICKSISDLKICSFDLECTSGDGNFPQPNRIDDKIIQIGSTFSRNGNEECYYKHIITLGSCDNIEGADVECYDTEQEVLMAWQRLLINEDPDILTGWNIFGFDETYLYERSILLGIDKEFGIFGRIKNKMCKFENKNLSSSALGDNSLKYYDTDGRVQIDLMKVVQRDYNLSSYKLDSVAEHFLTSKITKELGSNKFEVGNIKDLAIGNYIKLINENGDAINDSEKFKIENIEGNIITINKDIDQKVKKLAFSKDCFYTNY
jgi:DNA polymerase elongation subunit (family B)